jgi:hypothetical protein
LSSSGDLTSMPMGYPNKTFVSGQTSKRLFIEIRDQNECDDESLSPYSKLLNYWRTYRWKSLDPAFTS